MNLEISTIIKAPISKVWDALTNPALIKQYMFGTNTASDWKVGSPITFSGDWEGKAYEDKGKILAIEKEKFLKYNYYSAFSGKKDEQTNYSIITYSVRTEKGQTIFDLTQDNFENAEAVEHSKKNWQMIFGTIKKMLEG